MSVINPEPELFFRVYRISIKDNNDIEFLLEKEHFSDKRKNSIKLNSTFFNHKTEVDFHEKEVYIRSKIRPNPGLLIPFASVVIIAYLMFTLTNFYWEQHLAMIFIAIYTNYLLFIYLVETAHTKMQNHIYTSLYIRNYAEKLEN